MNLNRNGHPDHGKSNSIRHAPPGPQTFDAASAQESAGPHTGSPGPKKRGHGWRNETLTTKHPRLAAALQQAAAASRLPTRTQRADDLVCDLLALADARAPHVCARAHYLHARAAADCCQGHRLGRGGTRARCGPRPSFGPCPTPGSGSRLSALSVPRFVFAFSARRPGVKCPLDGAMLFDAKEHAS